MTASLKLSGTHVIMGVLNSQSLTWQIARAVREAEGDVIVTVQSAEILSSVDKLVTGTGIRACVCDVEHDAQLDEFFGWLAGQGQISGFVYGPAYADRAELTGRVVDTTRPNFARSLDVSCFGFLDSCRRVEPLMHDGAKILALTYGASQQSCDNYNVMGVAKAALEAAVRGAARDFGGREIAVNALSPTTVRTVAARAVQDPYPLAYAHMARSIFGRTTKPEEIGKWGAFMLSDFCDGMTGEIVYIDCGTRSSGMPPKRNAHIVTEMDRKYNPSPKGGE